MLKMSGTIIMQTVPALLPVEARKTCDYQLMSRGFVTWNGAERRTSMNGKGHSDARTASRFVIQKHCKFIG
jgi:hypothetical protein